MCLAGLLHAPANQGVLHTPVCVQIDLAACFPGRWCLSHTLACSLMWPAVASLQSGVD